MARVPPARLDAAAARAWADLCAGHAPALRPVDDQARLARRRQPQEHPGHPYARRLARRRGAGLGVRVLGLPLRRRGQHGRSGGDYPAGFLAGFAEGFGADGDQARAGRVLDMFALSDLVTRAPGHPVADQAAGVIRAWVADGVPVTL